MRTKKSKMEPRKSKWRVWMTVASVFAGVGVIAGGTVFGVFLTGGFEERVVNPEGGIAFDWGDCVFNETKSQLEISDSSKSKEFTLTITSPTEDVTVNRVELSFAGNVTVYEAEGKISNSIIQVPQYVYIGQPFTVKLMEEYLYKEDIYGNAIDTDTSMAGIQYDYIKDSEGNNITNVVGGFSTLRATSDYSQISSTELNIAVDTPVYDTKLRVFDLAGEEISQDASGQFAVIAGEKFTVESQYIPFKSRYMYGDETREKHTFYETGSQLITPHYGEEKYDIYFTSADTTSQEAIKLNAYTFKYADAETAYLKSLEGSTQTSAEFYVQSILYLAGNTSISKHVEQDMSIGIASIKSFEVFKTKLNDLRTDSSFKLYLNSYPHDSEGDFLGASIISNTVSGREVYALLKNVGIRFTHEGADAVSGASPYIKLTNCEKVIINEGLADEKHYYKPYTNVADIRYAYWEISALLEGEISLEIVLLQEEESAGTYTIFKQEEEEVTFNATLSIKTHVEEDLSWVDENSIYAELPFDGVETKDYIIPSLLSLVNIPSQNQFQNVMFFAYFEGANPEERTAKAQAMLGATGYDAPVTLETPNGEKYLFPLRSLTLSLKNTGTFELYFATIDRSQEIFANKIKLWCGNTKSITSQKSLYNSSVTSALLSLDDKKIYTGDTDTVVGVTFNIVEDSLPAFEENLSKMSVKLFSSTTEITSFFESQESSYDATAKTYTVSYKLRSASSIDFANKTCRIDQAVLTFNEGEENAIEWGYEVSTHEVYVYNPTTSLITSSVAEPVKIFNVLQRLEADGTYTLTIDGLAADLTTFIPEIVGTIEITDQHGNKDSLAGQWKFVTSDSSAIKLGGDLQTFEFGTAKVDGVSLTLLSVDDQPSNINYTFNIDSTGIAALKYDTEKNAGLSSMSEPQVEIGSATVQKFGATGDTITLANLVEFYLDDACTQAYSHELTFSVNEQTYASLTADQLTALKWISGTNEDGMLDMNWENPTIINIKHDFGRDLHLIFDISAPGISTTLRLVILQNKEIVGAKTYNSIYAEEEFVPDNELNDIKADTSVKLIESSGYPSGTNFNIIPMADNSNKYIISTDEHAKKIGRIVENEIIFNDFWESETKTFVIVFTPEGDNYYAVTEEITFTVARNIKISSTATPVSYNLYDASPVNQIQNLINIVRASDNTSLFDGSTGLLTVDLTFEMTGDKLYLKTDDQVHIARTDRQMLFEYNTDSMTQTVAVKYGDVVVGTFDIVIKLTADIYQDVANAITYTDGATPPTTSLGIIQKINDVKYVVIDVASAGSNMWKKSSIASDTLMFLQKDFYGSSTSLYALTGDDISFRQGDSLVNGLGDSSKYIVLRSTSYGEFIYIPAIVSAIGINPVRYSTAIAPDRYLETALLSEEYLLSEANLTSATPIYDEVTAGEVIDLFSKLVATNASLASISASNQYIKSAYVDPSDDHFKIQLNHLVDDENDHYAIVKFTITKGFSITLNYLIKILPNASAEDSVYPYIQSSTNASVENIVETSGEIDLEEIFDATTLHNGEKRFNVTYLSSGDPIDNLVSQNEIVSVVINDMASSALTHPSAWGKYIDLSFDESGSIFKYAIKSGIKDKIKVTICHSYPGSETSLSVIGGEQYYTFTFNDNSKNYSVRFKEQISPVPDPEYSITNVFATDEDNVFDNISIKNGVEELNQGFAWTADGGTYTGLYVYLVENAIAGQVESGNVQYNILNVVCSDGEDYLREIEVGVAPDITYEKYNYNKATGLLTLYTQLWLEQDSVVKFTIFTEQGYIANLNITLLANVTVTDKTLTLVAGKTTPVSEVFDISPALSYIEIESQKVGGTNVQYLDIDGSANIVVKSLSQDKEVDVTFKATFGGGIYRFTRRLILQANVTPKNTTSDDVVASVEKTVNPDDVYSVSTDTNIGTISSWEASSSSPAYAGWDKDDKEISTHLVAVDTLVNVTFTITLESGDVFQSLYTFTVTPAVTADIAYPNPTGTEALAYEYVQHDSTFVVGHMEGDGADVRNKYADGARVAFSANGGLDLDASTYRIQSLTNATVERGATALQANASLDSADTITFKRGVDGKDNGSDSIVVIAVSCLGVTVEYEFRILETVESVVFNTVTNNTTNGVEKIYVDKIKTTDLFAEGRMAEVTFSQSAYENEYYMVFTDDLTSPTTFYLSQAFYLKKNDFGQTRIIDIGHGMAGKDFIGVVTTETVLNNGVVADASGTITSLGTIDPTKLDSYLASIVEGLTLKNRVQLLYGEHLVQYHKYFETEPDYDNVDTTVSINTTNTITNTISGVDFGYKYSPDIDIQISTDTEASEKANYIELEANKEYPSLSRLYKITHPSNGKYLSSADVDTANIVFTVLNETDAGTALDTSISKYQALDGYNGFKSTTLVGNAQYLSFAKLEHNNKPYDFYLLPQGADNNGDYVVTKVTYSSTTAPNFKKEWVVVVKILPDYVVTYGGSAENASTEENGTITSNIDSLYRVTERYTEGGTTKYKTFTLAGNDGYISVKHQNGTDKTSELSKQNFKIYMNTNVTIGGITYNESDNVSKKFAGITNPVTSTVFSGITEVKFADQYYMLEGTDNFGYKYRIYFVLTLNGSSPQVTEESAITEQYTFSIGLEYEKRMYIDPADETKGYTTEMVRPNATVVISGLQAWNYSSGTAVNSPAGNIQIVKYQIFSMDGVSLASDVSVGQKFGTTSEPKVTAGAFPYLNGWAYGLSNTAKVKVVITIAHMNGGSATEKFQVAAVVNVTRAAQITTADNNVTIDVQMTDLGDHIKIGNNGVGTAINDTLEILVAPASTATFNIKYDGGSPQTVKISNTGRSVATTYYRSLSEIFGEMVASGKSIEITDASNVVDVFYIRSGNNIGNITKTETHADGALKNGSFTTSSIENDYIYIEDSSLLENVKYSNITKYYIVSANGQNYRVSRTYAVTGYYYSMAQKGTTTIIPCLSGSSGDTGWMSQAFDLYGAINAGAGVVRKDTATSPTYSNGKLRYYIVEDGTSHVGDASINPTTGEITLPNGLEANEYIKVRIEMIVTGPDRTFDTDDDTQITLGVLNLGKA